MNMQDLISEFEYEVNSTRKLLQAVPQKDIDFRPSPVSWTMGELAQHIATIYYWYVGTLTQDVYDMSADHLERGDPADIRATLELFESNVEKARDALKTATDESLEVQWTMEAGGQTVLGPEKRSNVVRSFLFNHIYHHRGEMIIYLRATGNKVPGIYGPTHEESAGRG